MWGIRLGEVLSVERNKTVSLLQSDLSEALWKNTNSCRERTQTLKRARGAGPLLEQQHWITRFALVLGRVFGGSESLGLQNNLLLHTHLHLPPWANLKPVLLGCTAGKCQGQVFPGPVRCQVTPPFQFVLFLSNMKSTKEWGEPFLTNSCIKLENTIKK